MAIPAHRRERAGVVRWFAVEPDPEGRPAPVMWALTDDEARSWIPAVGVDELHGHVTHWRATAAGRSGECTDRVKPGVCCFPEGVGTAVNDIEILITETEEKTWLGR